MKKNAELTQANKVVSKLREKVTVERRWKEDTVRRLQDTEVALIELKQDFLSEETARKRAENDLLERGRSLTEAEFKLKQAEDDLKNAEAGQKKAEVDLKDAQDALGKATQQVEQMKKSHDEKLQRLKAEKDEAVANAVSKFLKSEDFKSQIGATFKIGGAQYKEKVRAAGVLKAVKVHMGLPEDTTDEEFEGEEDVEDQTEPRSDAGDSGAKDARTDPDGAGAEGGAEKESNPATAISGVGTNSVQLTLT